MSLAVIHSITHNTTDKHMFVSCFDNARAGDGSMSAALCSLTKVASMADPLLRRLFWSWENYLPHIDVSFIVTAMSRASRVRSPN